jgi:hypothetical protein
MEIDKGRRVMADDEYPRVSVLRDVATLPLDVAATLAGRVRWLRGVVARLDAELGITYPPVEIVPALWFDQLADGTRGDVPGRVVPRPSGDSHRYVVQVTAPALLEYGDDLIEGVLAHEFLHVVFNTLEIVRRAEADPSLRRIDTVNEAYTKSWSDYRRLDAEWQVDPTGWLTPRLQRLASSVDDDNNPALRAAIARIVSHWIGNDLPVTKPDLHYSVDGITIDFEIVDRAALLAKARENGDA